jgi:aldose 1-epimerase
MHGLIGIKTGGLSLGVAPSLGASIGYFRWNNIPLLRDTPEAAVRDKNGRAFSAFPLIPFSNRIRAAAFAYRGTHYRLARDTEDTRHALHGTARFFPWQVTSQTESTLRCTLDYTLQNLDWPFAYQSWQDFQLLEDRLRVTIGLRNTHGFAAPFGLGLHPYFVRAPGASLRFSAGYVWAKDDQDIPTHSIPDAGRFSFTNQHAIDAGLIDNDYGGWNGVLEISAPGRPVLTLRASGVFSHLVLFTPTAKPYFAAEPVTHRPDAINPNGDPRDTGMAILEPGEVLEGEIEIIVAP